MILRQEESRNNISRWFYYVRMADQLPLSALLSQALVAFTIEFDNEFEHQTPHRTTNHGSTAPERCAPWLASMAMWIKFMRFVPDQGIKVRDFQQLASLTKTETKMWLTRLSKWWGYVAIKKNATETPSNWLISPTSGGKKALQVWRPLTGVIEKRWQERFGKDAFNELRQSLQSLVDHLNPELPDYLPILGFNMLSGDSDQKRSARKKTAAVSQANYSLPVLLSKALLAFATEYETESQLSMAISANVLRLVGEDGTRVRDLPGLSGVSKEAIAMAAKRLEDAGLAVTGAQEGGRLKAIKLTSQGRRARDTYFRLVQDIEKRWKAKFGPVMANLRRSLEHLVGDSTGENSGLLAGLKPYPDGWRAAVQKSQVLPHYPMILHRGGFPDGS